MELLDRVARSRAQGWHSQAKCLGMAQAFTSASHEEQVAVCDGTTAPWAKPCPVREECLEDIVQRTLEHGPRELTDGNLVCGGMLPTQVRVVVRARKKSPEAVYNLAGTCNDDLTGAERPDERGN